MMKRKSSENMDIVENYVKTENGKKIIYLIGDRQSFRCRQRSILSNGRKTPSLKFVSFKEMQKETKRMDESVIGPYLFDTVSRL
jgi:hypothetical protein